MSLEWYGPQQLKAVTDGYTRRLKSGCIYLSSAVKADISQPGTLRYNPTGKKGQQLKSSKTVYNFTHSRPGNPPYKQTGTYRKSITWELAVRGAVTRIGRVGTNMKIGRYLELGTRRMRARPHLRAALRKHRAAIAAILTRRLAPNELPRIPSNQLRSGHFGAGARKAGWA